ncbi:SDR family oxidoreductase [Pedobacter frigidisoli]|uniref:SDR family oxidoreductase n=1 Tax=Pedobacter frigidisoli TaxID=2530455 RepID=A0A4R0P6U5_9SPHI|nr:SDR family oxidoreductase [Pedobacter frigidisoli]TCD11222.1 SDR family oxidoreductase [Pedobacter frigidisoli]
MDFSNKNILVVGGSSGIGLALIKDLVEKGATVYNASRTSSEEWPAGIKHLNLDVLEKLDDLTTFLPTELHGLVYSVGSITLKPFGRVSEDDFINDYRLNVIGAAKVIQQALKNLKAAGASSIVLISSVAAQTGMGFHSSIAAAKAGVEGLTKSLAAEFSAIKVRVNAVAPSLTDTRLAASLLNSDDKKAASAKRHPLGKYGNPEDIAAAITFLLADESNWITGQIINIDGGMGSLRTNL